MTGNTQTIIWDRFIETRNSMTELIIVAAITVIAVIALPLSIYFLGQHLVALSERHASQLENAYSRSRSEVGEMNDRLMEMVNVHHWTRGSLDELAEEQARSFAAPKPPIEMDEVEEDEWASQTWGQAQEQADDVGADIAEVLGAAGVELEVDGTN